MAQKFIPTTNLPGGGAGNFKTTHWSVVLHAQNPEDENFGPSLEYLVETYWKPVYIFIRMKGKSHDPAKDLTQEFFALFLEKNFLKSVDREKGKFRTFLLTALSRFLMNDYARSKAIKRGGNLKALQSLEKLKDDEMGIGFEPAEGETPEETFNRNWAQALLARVFERLQEVCKRDGKEEYYHVLKEQFFGVTDNGKKPSYKEIADKLNLSEVDVTNYLHRAKKIYRDLLHDEIRSYVSTEDEVNEEIRDLWRSLSA